MSDTPETDAAAESNIYGVACKVDVDFARKLERERNKAEAGWLECRNFAQQMVDERDRYKSDAEVITKERDEAREALRVLFKDYKELADSGDAGFWELEDKEAAQPALRILQQREAAK